MSLAEYFPHLILDRNDSLVGETATAVFSPGRAYRYALARTWDTTKPAAVWICLNPSTADAFADDPTVRRITRFSKAWACGGFTLHNLFAYRATDPKALRQTMLDPVGENNDEILRWTLDGSQPKRPVVAAWGINGTLHGRDQQVLKLLTDLGVDTQCLGWTAAGHPRHPLYVPGSTVLRPVDPDLVEATW